MQGFAFSFMIVNDGSLGFGLLAGQHKEFEDIPFSSGKFW